MKPPAIRLIYELAHTPRAVAMIEGELINCYQAALIYSVIESLQNHRLRRSIMQLPMKHLIQLSTMIGERQIREAIRENNPSSRRFLESLAEIQKRAVPV